MAGAEGKKVKGDDEDSEPNLDWVSLGEINEKASDEVLRRETPHELETLDTLRDCSSSFVNPCHVPRMWGTTSYDQVTKEETATAYVYKPWLTADEVRVEIRRGRALRVIGQGDETVKVELRRSKEMRVREATASLSSDGVLTVVIPKRHRPWKWCEYADLVFVWFKTVRVGVSS